jgi:hypothetical protein
VHVGQRLLASGLERGDRLIFFAQYDRSMVSDVFERKNRESLAVYRMGTMVALFDEALPKHAFHVCMQASRRASTNAQNIFGITERSMP